MSTENDLILGAIADGHHKLQDIAEAVGIDVKTASNRLYLLKQKNLVARGDGGWMVPGAPTTAPTNVRVHRIADDGDDDPPRRKPTPNPAKANGKPRPAPAPAREQPVPAIPTPTERELEFAISESGAVLFKCVGGDRAGQLGEINCADALALYRLMSSVEFIHENA